MNNIRNFSIIAHIDHGKSTLSDRLIQICGGLHEREMTNQVLDSMDLERERGITIKAQSVSLNYQAFNGQLYKLNFIDTPGHVDFSCEVSRSLAACEGALLLIDIGQGVEAQTIANYYAAIEMNLKVVPVFNKIDLLDTDNPNLLRQEIKNIIGIDYSDIVRCSAKTGIGVINVLERIVHDIPPPTGNPSAPLQALIIDSWFDNYLGVVSLVRIKNGILCKGNKIKIMSTGHIYEVNRLGVFTPKSIDYEILNCGEVGWLVCSIKDVHGAPVGDTITLAIKPATETLPSFNKIQPRVYAGLFPINSKNYLAFRNALEKLSLNDASLFYESESSAALGSGFRCGFLGLLHMEIIQERLEREYNLQLIVTAPTVSYEVLTINNSIIYIDNPSKLPSINNIKELREPIIECHILLPKIYLGDIMTLCIDKRGIQTNMVYYGNQVALTYDIPMSEVLLDFFDRLKSISRGYASLDFKFKYFKKSDMVRIDILINGNRIDALSFITHRNNAFYRSRMFVNKLKEFIPRQQFSVIIQAAIGNHIIACSKINQFRKNVIAKCYGGDVSRKKKLLQNQREGKKRIKMVGKIELSQKVFLAILDINKDSK